MRNKIRIIKYVLLVILVILFAYFMHLTHSYKMPYVYCDKAFNIEYNGPITEETKDEILSNLKEIVGVSSIIYKEKDFGNNGKLGFSIQPFMEITIQQNLSQYKYIIVVAHELTHIKYQTKSEMFACYKSFELLYNSKYKDFALKYAEEQSQHLYDCDCWYYMAKYLAAYK